MDPFKKIGDLIRAGMIRDRYRLQRKLAALRKMKPGKPDDENPKLSRQLSALRREAERSATRCTDREASRPSRIAYDPELPITARKNDIIHAIKNHPVVIISGETGSGKTTQLPKFCIEAGRGTAGIIGCTQPRRIAAVNVARRIAQELGQPVGQGVGYKIRFEDQSGDDPYIKLMTDGILLAETQTDRFLNAYDTLIVDEAHERSLNIDFTLGILRRLIRQRRDLKLIITSATIDTEKFSAAFDDAPVIEVSGRMYPVETRYMPLTGTDSDAASDNDSLDKAASNKASSDKESADEDQGYVEGAAQAVFDILAESRSGDILVFMPSEQDIGEALELIRSRNMTGITALPLFARLSAKEQAKVFTRQPGRKIIVSTNVAETSLTIPGIKYVVDTGLARIPSYSPRTRTTALPISPISQSSADQRQGRCGRVENGICIRLYDEDDYNSRPFFTSPEILRSNLAEVILRMISLKLGDVAGFAFIDPPSSKSIKDGFDTLMELGAVTRQSGRGKHKKARLSLTPKGRIMAGMPIDPKLSRILIEAHANGCLKEAVVIATALSISDPRQRPAEKAQAADQKHAEYKDPGSDFITLLNIWNAYKKARIQMKSRSALRNFCRDNFLSFKRLREWDDIHGQILKILADQGMTPDNGGTLETGSGKLKSKEYNFGGPLYIALHKSLLAGYLAHIAHKKEKNLYNAAKGQQAIIFPGSGLHNQAGHWIMAAEYVKTSQLFARTVANIDPAWLEEIAPDLCTRTYSDPRWEKSRGQVVANEQVSLFGLVIVSGRSVSFGQINPEEAGEIFIRHALVEKEISRPFEFMVHNDKLIRELETLEHKTRKKDILASPEDLFLFYRSKLEKPFGDIRSFTVYLKKKGSQNFLKMTLADIQKSEVDPENLSRFPDALTMTDGQFRLEYQFKPGSKKDGVTLQVPAASAARVSGHTIDRLVPGLFEEKITALIKALPKTYRVKLVPVTQTAALISRELPRQDKPLFQLLSEFIKERFNVFIPPAQWSDEELPDHLKMRISIRDKKGREIKAQRSKSVLEEFSRTVSDSKDDVFERARPRHEKEQVTQWDFGDIDEPVILSSQKKDDPNHKNQRNINPQNFKLKGYLGLQAEKNESSKDYRIDLKLFETQSQADSAHFEGVMHLILKNFPDQFKALRKDITRSADIKQTAPLFSGQTVFQDQVFDLICTTLFKKNIKTRNAFDALCENEIPKLYTTGQEIMDSIAKTGSAYRACFELISKLSFKHQAKAKNLSALGALEKDLKNLVPPSFAGLYAYEKIRQLPRYIACIHTRAQKTVDNPIKMEQAGASLAVYTEKLHGLIESLSGETTPEKAAAIEDFFWLLEEYKISLFAQHLKTHIKISAKRLNKSLEQISTML